MVSSNADALPETEQKVSRIQKNQALYQQALMELAYNSAVVHKDNAGVVGFDFRGRAILTLPLNDQTMECLAERLSNDAQKDAETAQDKIERLTGIKVARSVRCALDITTVPSQSSHLSEPIASLREKYQKIYNCLPPPQRDLREQQSVVGLYEEVLSYLDHQHHALKSYLARQASEGGAEINRQLLESYYYEAKKDLQKRMEASCNTLSKSLKSNELNESLNKLRLEIAHGVRGNYLEVLQRSDFQGKDETLAQLVKKDFNNHFMHTAAHHHDMLGTDFSNGLISYITQSGDRTAHNKAEWENESRGDSALRVQTRHRLNRDGSVTKSRRPRASTRAPSLSSAKDTILQGIARTIYPERIRRPSKEEVQDVERIKRILKKSYHEINQQVPDNKPMVYNLLTSLESSAAVFLDLAPMLGPKNGQNLSAERIIKGVHAYNRDHTDDNDNQLVLLQNMGVNHYTQNLSNEGSPRLNEATLMADLAMLYTLSNNLSEPRISTCYNEALAQYKDFLSNSSDSDYFHQSSQGKEAVERLNTFKANFAKAPLKVQGAHNSFRESLAIKLTNLYAQNEHYDEKNQNLIQALSIFLEEKSISGCKSANERNEDVQKRVAMLISLEERFGTNVLNSPPKDKDIVTSDEENEFLQTLRDGGSAEQLRRTLSLAANKHRAYGDECSFSHADQASASKLKPQSKNLYKAKKWVDYGFKVMCVGATIGAVAASFALSSPLTGLIGLSVGGGLGAIAAVIGFVGLGIAAIGGIAMGVGMLKGYDTNCACELEMTNIKNGNAKPLQTHKDKGKGVQKVAKEIIKGIRSIIELTTRSSSKSLSSLGGPSVSDDDTPQSKKQEQADVGDGLVNEPPNSSNDLDSAISQSHQQSASSIDINRP